MWVMITYSPVSNRIGRRVDLPEREAKKLIDEGRARACEAPEEDEPEAVKAREQREAAEKKKTEHAPGYRVESAAEALGVEEHKGSATDGEAAPTTGPSTASTTAAAGRTARARARDNATT